jgi:hypothetical protein
MMWFAFAAGVGAGAAVACLLIGIAGLLRNDRQVRPRHPEDRKGKEGKGR